MNGRFSDWDKLIWKMLPSPMRALGRRWKENSPDELHVAVLTGKIKKIKHLVKKGVHIESVNPQGQTSLFCASFGGDYEVVKVLLRLGANPNRRCGSAGAAPIHAASYRGSRRVLRTLVEAGGDLSLRDAEFRTPRDYALKQPSPVRRQKILSFLDLLFAMTLHRISSTLPNAAATLPTGAYLPDGGSSATGTLKGHQKLKKGIFGGSQMSLSRKSSHQSTASVWSSCVSDVSSSQGPPSDDNDSKTKEIVLTPNLHKSVSCHLLDQLCVTTSLPLLSPAQLQRPLTPTPAYTCGGPTVYSSFSWLGTPVTVRRPTPALSLSKEGAVVKETADGGTPDQEAVRSLLHELAFLRRLRHPGFLEVMAACHVTHPSPDHVTLVYQHISHGSLYHHLHAQHHDLSVGAAVDILICLVEALLFMHSHGWFHCGLSSHALHLVTLGNAKLGGFEHAFETQVKGVGMRAEHLSRAAWLCPWQAPEVILEKMVSVRSEVYSVAAIIWEIWAGMPPWAGVEEEEVSRKIGSGETLPPLKGLSLSLVSYLTEYGLKWNAHERELDLQEIHTMLRSLRIQCNEEERVPPVTSWGPPSIPNTPVIGRQTDHSSNHLNSSLSSSSSSSGELRLGDVGGLWRRSGPQKVLLVDGLQVGSTWRKVVSGDKAPRIGELGEEKMLYQPRGRMLLPLANSSVIRQTRDAVPRSIASGPSQSNDATEDREQMDKVRRQVDVPPKMKSESSRDSGFSTPFSRTPSPIYDRTTTARSATILTSTPVRPASNTPKTEQQRPGLLLPNKVTSKAFIRGSEMVPTSPDFVPTSKSYCSSLQQRHSNDLDEEDFTYVRDAAKRAFFQQRDEGDNDSDTTTSSSVSSPSSQKEGRTQDSPLLEATTFTTVDFGRRRHLDVVKRGLSLSNICSSAYNCHSATVFTRTTSHISLSSSSSSTKSSTSCGDYSMGKRPPQRTISQITLTLKKLSVSSSSSVGSAGDPLPTKPKEENLSVEDQQPQSAQRVKRKLIMPPEKGKSIGGIKNPQEEGNPQSSRRGGKNECRSAQVIGIKPASHQLTHHSSSCSLASGPSSPGHKSVSVTLLGSSRSNRLANSHDSLPTSQSLSNSSLSKYKTMPPNSCSLSLFNDKGSLLSEATAANKSLSRRHSVDTSKRSRRSRRRHEMEFEEEFIDDEFDANLYDQPHMQLSVGSSENLLENRLSFSLVHDSASSASLSSRSQQSRHLTSSEDDDEEGTKKSRTSCGGSSRRPPMKALQEMGDSDSAEEAAKPDKIKTNPNSPSSNHENDKKLRHKSSPLPRTEKTEKMNASSSCSSLESEDVFLKDSSCADEAFLKDFEPLKSSRALRTLEKSFSNYLPTYSIGSDTEDSADP